MSIKVRNLKRKDRATLAALIKKFADVAGTESLVNMVPSSDKAAENDEAGESAKVDATAEILEAAFGLLEQMLKVIESDVSAWFCDLISVTKEEYDDLDFDIELQIIEDIISQKGFEDFFSRGSRVLKKIKTLAGPFLS